MADVEIDLVSENAQELIAMGIRCYAIKDFSKAAAAFGRASEIMSEKLGDGHDSLGDLYINYAKSLLEVSREESGPLGDAIPKGDEDDLDESDIEESEEVQETSDDDPKDEKKEEDTKVSEGDVINKEEKSDGDSKVEKEKKKDEEEIKNGNSQEENEKTEEKEGNGKTEEKEGIKNTEEKEGIEKAEEKEGIEKTEEKEGKDSLEEMNENVENDDNCSDLQLAWEVLEVAKRIFIARGDSGKESLAEVLILLGEVSMESENFESGIADMTAGLEIQKEIFEPLNRKIAETFYKLGMAYSTLTQIEKAVDCFNSSLEILNKRIIFLQSDSTENETKANAEDEIVEIKILIPEIEEKIADIKSIKGEIAAKMEETLFVNHLKIKKDIQATLASDISHLVKRKRKADDSNETEELPPKRPTP